MIMREWLSESHSLVKVIIHYCQPAWNLLYWQSNKCDKVICVCVRTTAINKTSKITTATTHVLTTVTFISFLLENNKKLKDLSLLYSQEVSSQSLLFRRWIWIGVLTDIVPDDFYKRLNWKKTNHFIIIR